MKELDEKKMFDVFCHEILANSFTLQGSVLMHWWILEVKQTEPWGYIPATGAGEGDTHSIMS